MPTACDSDSALVSVVLPVFNGAIFLQRTLRSIAQQNHRSIEVIIVDDGSSDHSGAIIEDWGATTSFPVIVLRNHSNFGVYAALADASARAKGRYIAQIGHDDVWDPGHLSGLVAALEADGDASAAFADVAYINENDESIFHDVFKHERIDGRSQLELFAALVSGNFLCAPASLFRRSLYEARFWGVSNERLQDYELWLFLLTKGHFVRVITASCRYRIHGGNLSSTTTMALQSRYELLAVQLRVFSAPDFEALYLAEADMFLRREFIYALFENCLVVQDYFGDLIHAHMLGFERLQLADQANAAPITAIRAAFSGRLGMLRKYGQLSKSFPQHLLVEVGWLPFLVPANAEARVALFGDLIESFIFRDGSQVALEGSGNYFFYLARVDQIKVLGHYASFSRAVAERRIIAFDGDVTGPQSYGFSISQGAVLTTALRDRLFRFFEDEHNSCRCAATRHVLAGFHRPWFYRVVWPKVVTTIDRSWLKRSWRHLFGRVSD